MLVIKKKERKRKKNTRKHTENTLIKGTFSHNCITFLFTFLRDCEFLVLKMTKYFVKLTGTKFLVMRSKADQFPTERKYLATHFPTYIMR